MAANLFGNQPQEVIVIEETSDTKTKGKEIKTTYSENIKLKSILQKNKTLKELSKL